MDSNSCGDLWLPKIPQYVDTELSEPEMRAMEEHMRGCSSCAVEALRQVRLKHETKLAARRHAPSPEFRRKIAAIAGEQSAGHSPVRKPGSGHWAWAPLFAAAIVALMVAGILLNHRSERRSEQARSQLLLSELTDLHAANLAASSPVDVVSSDRHTVKPWFQGKVPFSFNLPELAGSSFVLVGGRLAYIEHEPAAHLIYNVGAHHVSVFILRDQPDLARAFSTQESSRNMLQFHVESWNAQELRYFVVGDAGEGSLHTLADMLRRAEAGEATGR